MNEQARTNQELIEEISVLKNKIKELAHSGAECKIAEEALREGEQRLHSIIDGSPIPAFVIGKDHRVIHWNKALEEMSRIKSENIVGTCEHWRAFYNEERPSVAELLVDEAVELVPRWYAGKYIKSPLIEDAYEATDFFPALGEEGKWLRFTAAAIRDSKGIVVAAIETLEDITERKKVEEALREGEQRLHSIIDGSPIPAFVIGKDHRVIHWNKALEEMSRIKPENIVGTCEHWRAFYNEERPCVADLLVDEAVELVPRWYAGKYIKSPLIEDAYEATDFFPALGEEGKWLRFTAAAIRDSKGIVVAAIETLEDITERKLAEKALQESYRHLDDIINALLKANLEKQKQLIQSEKLSSLGQLVSGCAHEINNPIQFILGNMRIFDEAFEEIIPILDKQVEENPDLTLARLKYPFFRQHIKILLEDMTNGAKRIRDIVADLKTFARQDEGRLDEEVDINEVVRVCIRLIHNKIKRYRIEEDLEPALPKILGSENKLEQVVTAIIINAAEALGDCTDGTIKITTRVEDDGMGICLSILDNGPGMTDEIKNRIFDPFFTTKQKYGTGLGLSISYGIIDEHGGYIEVESEPGKGAAFRFHLPVKHKEGDENKKKKKIQRVLETTYNFVNRGTLDYNFIEQQDVQAYYVRADIHMGTPKTISLFVKGDGSLHQLGLAYRDKLDQKYTVSFNENALQSTDWHLVSARIPDNAKFPLKLESIYVLKNNSDVSHKSGAIELDDIYRMIL